MYGDLLDSLEKDIDGLDINKYNIFYRIMDDIINLNNINRCNNSSLCILPLEEYLKEYCTIKFNIGRQIGKTEYIKRKAKENDVIIILNNAMRNYFRNVNSDLFTINQFLNEKFDKRYDSIWFDNFSFCSRYISKREYIEEVLYIKFAKDRKQTFILLG